MKNGHARIFCFDEDHENLKSVVYLLKSDGYHVLGAQTVSLALDIAGKEDTLSLAVISLVNASEVKPAGSASLGAERAVAGIHVAKKLRRKFRKAPLLFIMEGENLELLNQVKALGNCEIIMRSSEPSFLLYTVKNGLSGGYLLGSM